MILSLRFPTRHHLTARLWLSLLLPMTYLIVLLTWTASAQTPIQVLSNPANQISPTDQNPGQTADAIIARVNGKALLLSRLKEAAFDQSIPLASLMANGIRSEGYRQAITQLVDQTLLAQKATEDGIEVDDMKVTQVVDEMFNSLKQQLGGEDGLNQFLEERHLRQADLREMFRQREQRAMMITQLVARNVRTDSQRLEEFIAARKTSGQPAEEVNLAQILVVARPDERDTDKGRARYQRAIFTARQAGKNPEKFAEVAAEYSDEPMAAETGGYIGWVNPDKLRPALTSRLQTMKTGEISEPIQTDLGYHVLFLIDRHTSRDLLFAEEFGKEHKRLVQQLRAEATIQLFDLNGQPMGRLALEEEEPSTQTATQADPEAIVTPN